MNPLESNLHIVSEQSADIYKALDGLLSNLLRYILFREKEEKNYALRKEIEGIYDDVNALRELCMKYYHERQTNNLNLILAIFYPAIVDWTTQIPKLTREIQGNLLRSLNKKRSDSTNHNAPNFKTAEKIEAQAAEQAKEHFFSSMLIKHYPSITLLQNAITIAFVDASGSKSILIPEIRALLDTVLYDIAEFRRPFKPFFVFSFSESYSDFDQYSFLSKKEKTTVGKAFQVWLNTFHSLNNDLGFEETSKETQHENSTNAVISSLLENSKISFDRLGLFYLLLNHNHEPSVICYDILERLKEYASSSEDCYTISILEYLTSYGTPSVIVNWLSWQKHQKTIALKNREELFAANSTALNGMKGYLTNILIKTISKPIIMEAALNRSLFRSAQMNQCCSISSCGGSNVKVPICGTDYDASIYKKLLQNLNPDIADLNPPSAIVCHSFMLECNEAQKGLVSKLQAPEMISLLSVSKKDKSARKYSFANIVHILQRWLADTDEELAINSFVMLTGYNVCAELVYGLQKICLYKDSFDKYESELDLLIQELVRYMHVLGSQTALLIHEMLYSLKEANMTYKLWKFSKGNDQDGCAAIHLIYDVMHAFPIEQLTNELRDRYVSVLCPEGVAECEHKFFDHASNCNDPDELQRILNTFDSKVVAAAHDYKVADRNRELESASAWGNYKITDAAWNSGPIKGLSCDPRDKYPTNTAGRWYCHLQQIFIRKLNS